MRTGKTSPRWVTARGAPVKVAGKKVRWETETTEAKRPERIAFRSVESPFPFEISYTLVDTDGSTEVRHDGSTEALGGFFGKLADPLVARMYQRDMNSNLAKSQGDYGSDIDLVQSRQP